ncbi:uncharacterized protein LOC127006649 isoform X3 [Eriocheir sinensis]|uniref:uncharacterized protein LOC127006649 isoform X3 n=1 Tax=Eriocheir sinensis TaxID=95602 RepID=UPI0021C89642|nr:uncharacterized protein LOC127006649 isoform X3 [Eriocheir sinensis]
MSSHTTQHRGHQYYSGDTGVKCAPPVFGGEKSYVRWRTELEAWLLVTNVDKKKQAITVALSFPEGSEVRDRIFGEVEMNDLNSEDGMAKLLEYLDKWYKKDKLTGAYDSWADFDSFRKGDNTKMESYISEFEKRHKKLLEYGIVLPNSVLAFKLLDGARLSQGVKQQTVDTLDFNKPDAMFQQVVAVLKKVLENKPVASSGNMPVASSGNMPVASSGNMPVASSGNMPVASSGNMPVASSGNKPVASSGNMPVASSGNKPVASSGNKPVASSSNMPVALSGNIPVASSGNKPVASSGNMPVASSGNKPVASSGKKPVAPSGGAQSYSSANPGITIKSEPLYGANEMNHIGHWTNERNEGGNSVQRANKNALNGRGPQRNNPGDSSRNTAKGYVITNSMVPPQPQMQYMCHPVVLQVNNLVVQLTLKPNRFEQIARQLTAVFSWQVQDTFLMRELIAVIFEQGVGEVNFRYNGARLCQHLGKNVTQAYNGPTFRSLLLQRCQEEFEVREMYLHNEPERVCGYTLFLAELFTQLVTVNGRPYDILRGALCHLLTTLLSQPTDANLKCVAQVLKCTGNTLDCTNRSEMDQVMCSLKDVAMTAPVASNTRSLLLAVIELRASNWGCGPPSPKESPASTPTHTNIPLGTVYYGPGGIIQRVEDDPEDSASDTDDFINYGWSPAVEELEGDVAEAFEEFLRLQQ